MVLATSYMLALLFNLSATILIYIGVFFMPGILFPKYLAPIYSTIELFAKIIPLVEAAHIRYILALTLFILPANLIIGQAFMRYPDMAVSLTNIIAVIIVLISLAIFRGGVLPYLDKNVFVAIIILVATCTYIGVKVKQAEVIKASYEAQQVEQVTKT